MVIIFLNILILFFYAIRLRSSSLNKNTQRFLFLLIAFLHLMFLHTCFDASLFPDLKGYNTYFDSFSNPHPAFNFEIGWYFLNKILHGISHNSFILLFSVSIVMILGYLIAIKRYSAIPWLSVFLLLCTVFYDSLFVLRQNLAIPICLMTIPYIIERKPVRFALLTLLAVSFHYSALVWFMAYFIYPVKLNLGFYFLMIIFSVLSYFLMDIILKNLIIITPKIMAYTTINNSGGTGVLKVAAVNVSTIGLSLYCFGNHNSIKGYNKLFFQLSVVALFLNLIDYFGTSFTLFSRLDLYFTVSSILLIPNALANIENKRLYYISIPVICVCYLFLLMSITQYGYGIKF
jgi:EpsG family